MACKTDSKNVCCGGMCMTKGGNNLLTWTNPKKSGIVFGSILSVLLLIKYVNIISLFFYISTFSLLGAGIAEYVGKIVTGTGFITKFKPAKKATVGEFADKYAPHVVTVLKKLELKIQDLYTSVDIEKSVRAGIASFFLYKLTSAFSLWSLVFIITILAFTVPPVYLANKQIIDKNIEQGVEFGKVKLDEGYKVANEKLGPHLEKAKNAAAPVLKLIESKLPVRTAGTTVNSSDSPISATTSSATHATASGIKKVSTNQTESTEIDFNSLGEQLKKEAEVATANEPVYTKEKIDPSTPL